MSQNIRIALCQVKKTTCMVDEVYSVLVNLHCLATGTVV